MFPTLSVVIVTYNRVEEFERTISALCQHIIYPRDKILFYIVDDCSLPEVQHAHKEICSKLGITYMYSSSPVNLGWGANVNRILRVIANDGGYVYFTEDDYVVAKPLNLALGVAVMEAAPHLGMLRYRGTAGSKIKFVQREVDLGLLPDHVEGVGLPGKCTYLEILPDSTDLYLYSHGPHLRRKTFHKYYGFYPEGLKLGATEESYAHMVKDKYGQNGAPSIGILPDWVNMWFNHIGKSYQHTQYDRGIG